MVAIKEMLSFSNDTFIANSSSVKRYIGEKIDTKKTLEEYKVLFEK